MSTIAEWLVRNNGEAMLMLDKDGYIQFVNPATSMLTGYTEKELLNQPFCIFTNDKVKTKYILDQAVGNKKIAYEGWMLKKNNSRVWIAVSIYAGEENGVASYCCILRDATAAMEEKNALRQSEASYRLMVEKVKDYCIFLLDSSGHIMTWNEGARSVIGYTPHEIIGKHFSIFYTMVDLESKKPERELKIAAETGKYEEEGWRIRKNGSLFWTNVVITALYNEQNVLVGFSKVTRDLSERRQNEEAMRLSEERYRLLVEHVADYGIFMMDEQGRIVSWNEGAKKILGYAAGEIIGKYFSIFYPEEDLLKNKPAMELRVAMATGKYEEEGWRIRKDGSRFWANVVITAVYNADSILIGFSKVTRDLTERKNAESALMESNIRYRQLTDELRAINTKLSLANEELEQFNFIVSHDLQEPVRTIKSFLQLIDIRFGEGRYKEVETYISKSINAANRMRELIQNLLQYSQLDRSNMVAERVEVADLLERVLQNLKEAVDTAHANIIINSEVQFVEGDPIQLTQLLQNLLSNALKFTDTARPEIKIECRIENGHARFAVSDNGIGISEDNYHKVFEIFRRLHTAKEYPGTGIGLAICKKIVDRHRGRIWPESRPGQGTTFYFTLNEEKIPA